MGPGLRVEATFPFGLTLGNSYSDFKVPFGPGQLEQASLGFRLEWYFFDRKLQLVSRYDAMTTTFSNYSASSHSGYGVEGLFKLPITKNDRIFVNFGGGWSYISQVTLSRDTGVPSTTSDFGNARCSLFTLGPSSGCGDILENVTIPRSTFWHLRAGVGWVW